MLALYAFTRSSVRQYSLAKQRPLDLSKPGRRLMSERAGTELKTSRSNAVTILKMWLCLKNKRGWQIPNKNSIVQCQKKFQLQYYVKRTCQVLAIKIKRFPVNFHISQRNWPDAIDSR